jgi:hypothetical protein
MSTQTPIQTATDHTRTVSRRVLAACAILRRAGCRVLLARAKPWPKIVIDHKPPLDWLQASPMVSAPQFGVFAAKIGRWNDGIQIEWTQRRTRT